MEKQKYSFKVLSILIFELFSISSDRFRPVHPSFSNRLSCDELREAIVLGVQKEAKEQKHKFNGDPDPDSLDVFVCVCKRESVHTCELASETKEEEAIRDFRDFTEC